MENHNDVELAETKTIGSDYDAAAEARVRRKLDRNMIPLFFILCECMIASVVTPIPRINSLPGLPDNGDGRWI